MEAYKIELQLILQLDKRKLIFKISKILDFK